MPIPSRTSQNNQHESWNEYRRLVLAELERLNDYVERLRTQIESIRTERRIEIAEATNTLKNLIEDKISRDGSALTEANKKELELIISRLEQLEKIDRKKTIADLKDNKWGFATAAITIIGSLAVSIVNLVMYFSGMIKP